jgi:thiamine transport system permease protein
VVVDGLNLNILAVLQQPVLWQVTFTSLRIALAAGLLCVILTMMLLWSSRELYARQARKAGQALELTGMLILAMPGIVLATGFFLLFNTPLACPKAQTAL